MNNKVKFFLVSVLLMAVTAYQFGQLETAPITNPVHAEMVQNVQEAEVNDQAIRIRVIPHSNAFEDQLAKRIARYAIDELLADHVGAMGTVESTRAFLVENIPTVHSRLSEIFSSIGYETTFEVTYGQHLFPEKTWGEDVFPAGYYESLVVRIGEGRGNNWWCFVNPGVCLGPALDELTPAEGTGWNFMYQARETAQQALVAGDFSLYINTFLDSWFGGDTVEAAAPVVAQAIVAEEPAQVNWFLFDDEK